MFMFVTRDGKQANTHTHTHTPQTTHTELDYWKAKPEKCFKTAVQ